MPITKNAMTFGRAKFEMDGAGGGRGEGEGGAVLPKRPVDVKRVSSKNVDGPLPYHREICLVIHTVLKL